MLVKLMKVHDTCTSGTTSDKSQRFLCNLLYTHCVPGTTMSASCCYTFPCLLCMTIHSKYELKYTVISASTDTNVESVTPGYPES